MRYLPKAYFWLPPKSCYHFWTKSNILLKSPHHLVAHLHFWRNLLFQYFSIHFLSMLPKAGINRKQTQSLGWCRYRIQQERAPDYFFRKKGQGIKYKSPLVTFRSQQIALEYFKIQMIFILKKKEKNKLRNKNKPQRRLCCSKTLFLGFSLLSFQLQCFYLKKE